MFKCDVCGVDQPEGTVWDHTLEVGYAFTPGGMRVGAQRITTGFGAGWVFIIPTGTRYCPDHAPRIVH
jgi:hypothetical protein